MSKRILSVLILLLLAGGILFAPALPVLSVSNKKNPSQRFYSINGFRNGFVISYTHSVNKGRVKDFYKAEGRKLVCGRTVFSSYGAGIPEPQETPGAVFTVTDDGYEISNINRTVPRLAMAVGIVANHAISVHDKSGNLKDYFLADFFKPQTSIIIQIKNVSIIDYFFHSIKNKTTGGFNGNQQRKNN